MKIRLLDYAGNRYEICIPEGITRLSGEIISGDMVLNTPPFFLIRVMVVGFLIFMRECGV